MDDIREVVHTVLTLVKAMVDKPDAVRIDVIAQPADTIFRARVVEKMPESLSEKAVAYFCRDFVATILYYRDGKSVGQGRQRYL